MNSRDRVSWPLVLSLVFSVLFHGAAAWGLSNEWFSAAFDKSALLIRKKAEPEDRIQIGQISPSSSKLNWISYEDYQKLISPHQAPLDQAAVQDQVKPDPLAQQTPVKPTDPGPRAPQPRPQAAAPARTPEKPSPQTPPALAQAAVPASLPQLPDAPAPTPAADAVKIELPAAPPAPQPAPDSPRKTTSAPAQEANPTASPLEKRQSPPVTRLKDIRLKPGEVVAREGLRINTIRPQFGTIALLTAAPTDPEVEVTFDKDGQVIAARVLKSSGYANVDGPILNSLYRWTAEGPQLKQSEGPIAVKVHIDL